ncbi:MAG TPA: phosphatase PAP2 family protein [Cytophagaceae bacterium]
MFIKKHKWYSIKVPVVALGSISLNIILKIFFSRPRPVLPHLSEASGLSFPSGHAMMSFSFYGLILYLVWVGVQHKLLKYSLVLFLIVLIMVIGLSRVYLRVHYATDVIAGFALGIIWLIISITVLKRIEKFSGRKFNPLIEEN